MTYSDWQRRDHIREVQEYLRTLALTDNIHRELAVDGIYGEETAKAVRSFQQVNGLSVTGKVDFETWERLAEDYLDALALLSEAQAAQHFPSPQHAIRPGNRGNLVYILQAILNTLTEAWEALADINVNGEYDDATERRVKELQAFSGFPETGEVDRYFWDHLITWYNSLSREV